MNKEVLTCPHFFGEVEVVRLSSEMTQRVEALQKSVFLKHEISHQVSTREDLLLDAIERADVKLYAFLMAQQRSYFGFEKEGDRLYHIAKQKDLESLQELAEKRKKSMKLIAGIAAVIACQNNSLEALDFLLTHTEPFLETISLHFSWLIATSDGKFNNHIRHGATPLQLACMIPNIDMAHLLLKKGAQIDHGGLIKTTALALLIDSLYDEDSIFNLLKLLLENKANPNYQLVDGKTPLHLAAKKRLKKCADLLISFGADVNVRDAYGCTPLMAASNCRPYGAQSPFEIARLLLEKGADPHSQNHEGATALVYAAEQGHLEVCQLLLTLQPDESLLDKEFLSPFLQACRAGQTVIVRFFLEKGFYDKKDPWFLAGFKMTKIPNGLSITGERCYIIRHEVRALLIRFIKKELSLKLQSLERKLSVSSSIEIDPDLASEVKRVHENLASIHQIYAPSLVDIDRKTFDEELSTARRLNEELLQRRSDLIEKSLEDLDKDRFFSQIDSFAFTDKKREILTFIFRAIAEGQNELISKIMIEQKGQFDTLLLDVFLHCCKIGASGPLEELHKYYKDIYLLPNQGPFLAQACRSGFENIVQLLISAGVDINKISEVGLTPLMEACACGNLSIIELLLKNGADTNIMNTNGEKVLHFAVAKEFSQVVALLLNHRVDVDQLDSSARTPAWRAVRGNHIESLKELLKFHPKNEFFFRSIPS